MTGYLCGVIQSTIKIMKNYFYKKYQFKFTNTFYNKLIFFR